MQQLLVLQSLWAMERRQTDGVERTLEESVEMIVNAGYDGFSLSLTDLARSRRLGQMARSAGKAVEGQWFPKTVEELKPGLEIAAELGVHHLDIQPDVRPRKLDDCLPLLEGWMRLAEDVDFPVYIETHRDRMTTDLFFVLDMLERLPDLPLLADLSHFLVGREFAWPVDDVNHAMIHRVLDNSWAFHGRVASREQVQIEIAFPHHKMWLDLFADWWAYGFASWRKRAGADDTLAFTCELGPQPYAISGRDGNDTTDRWAEGLILQRLARELWDKAG
jgi:hypothetical protein